MQPTAKCLAATVLGAFLGTLSAIPVAAMAAERPDLSQLERVKQELVPPPMVPDYVRATPAKPRIVEILMEIEEKEIEIEPGVFVWAFTYDGSVPGPLVVVHEGDYVELTLVNKSENVLPHNIDFHAATGALGGGELTLVNPGESVVLRFKAIKPGVFIYHCAPGGVMVPWHVVHGMNGAIMVLPRGGLKNRKGAKLAYDRVFYIGEQDYYIPKDASGKFKRYKSPTESLADDLAVMRTLIPTHLFFNGVKGALTGDNALKASVGENVLFVHFQANRQSYPHLIGGHGDYVWERGSFSSPPDEGLESWEIAAGSASAFMYKFKQPGTYVYLSHNLIEAFLFGALAIVKVDGEWDNDLMEQLRPPHKQ